MELEEVCLFLDVEGDTNHLSSSTQDGVACLPLLRRVSSLLSEDRSPAGVAEFHKEARRLGLSSFALVKRLVHPNFLEITIHFSLSALANVLATSTLSTVYFTSRAKGGVSELDSQSAPDRSVFEVGLVAGFDLRRLAVRRNSDGLDFRGLGVELSSHGTIKASSFQLHRRRQLFRFVMPIRLYVCYAI